MGAPMAYNLAKAGHTILGFDTENVTVEMVEILPSVRNCVETAKLLLQCYQTDKYFSLLRMKLSNT